MNTPHGVEFARIQRIAGVVGRGVAPVGIGDDSALINVAGNGVLVCVDTIVEGRHFTLDLSSPQDVGWKAIAVNVSDIAAMGGRSVAAVIALNKPVHVSEDEIDGLYQGLAAAGEVYGVQVVGGDTVKSNEWSIAVTVIGAPGPQVIRRNGANPGDVVILAGKIGAAAAALAGSTDPAHLAAHRRPVALAGTGVAVATVGVTSMIDISDGVGGDLGHIADESAVSIKLDSQSISTVFAEGCDTVFGDDVVNRCLGGGEDFALALTCPPDRVEAVLKACEAAGEVTGVVIGDVTEVVSDAPDVTLDGRSIRALGYDHG